MSETVIHAEGLCKRYRIGERERYLALRDVLTHAFTAPFRRNGNRRTVDYLWALRDVSFDIQQGEVVGLIGRNGAGKTTLLKILSRITRPTAGYAELCGRVGSLLEVGTGFHLELTGRENVFLSGAVLGMKKTEIFKKFDEIVAFSEVERFLDTPLKHYSSGMQMRLAFAVAAHLEPEILLVDEVLAVGDASFQKKCLGKMKDVAHHGRTILFVSHNIAAVKALCSKAIFLKDGTIVSSGDTGDVVEDYFTSVSLGAGTNDRRGAGPMPGNESIRLWYVRITPPEDSAEITIDTGVQIEIGFENFLENINLGCTVYLSNREGVLIFESGHRISSDHDSRCGFYQLTGKIPGHLLNAGHYSMDVLFGKDQRYALLRVDGVVSFEVVNTATGRGSNMSVAAGVIRPLLPWSHSFKKDSSSVKQP